MTGHIHHRRPHPPSLSTFNLAGKLLALLGLFTLSCHAGLKADDSIQVEVRDIRFDQMSNSPVVILQENPPIPSPDPESSWPMASDPLRLRRQVLRFGLEGLPEPPHLLSQTVEGAQPPGATSETPGLLRRYEYQKFLNPGGPK